MFGALNRFISRLDGEPQDQRSNTGTACGFQVLRNQNSELPLEPWFDFIIGINGRTIDNPDPSLFSAEVRNCAGTSISLGIWCAKGQRIREIYVPVPREAPSLNLSLQWQQLSSTEDVWHILDVTPNSPADLAGLLPYGDYVIGSPEVIVRGESGLGDLIEDNIDRPLRLLVYNHEYNVTRPIDITPSKAWGGQGALGCTLGYGALHRIPAPLEEPPHAPGETLFATDFDEKAPIPEPSFISPTESNDFLVPANIASLTAPGTAPPPPASKKKVGRAHHQISPASELDQYFEEGEAKSREVDHAPPVKSGAGIPPPPKSGGPPKG